MPKSAKISLDTILTPTRSSGGSASSIITTPAPSVDFGISPAYRFKDLPRAERDKAIDAEQQVTATHLMNDMEKTALLLEDFHEETVRAWITYNISYYLRFGRKSKMSRVSPLAISSIEYLLSARLKRKVKLSDYPEPEQVAIIEAYFSGVSRPDQLKTAIKKIAQPALSPLTAQIHSIYSGKFNLLTEEYSDVWEKMSKDAQLSLLISGFPNDLKALCKDTLKEMSHDTYWDGLGIIAEQASTELQRLRGNELKAERDNQALPSEVKSPPDMQKANLLRNGKQNCTNCTADGRMTTGHELPHCKYECAHRSCRSKEPHLGRFCREWTSPPMTANLAITPRLAYIHEDEMSALDEESIPTEADDHYSITGNRASSHQANRARMVTETWRAAGADTIERLED